MSTHKAALGAASSLLIAAALAGGAAAAPPAPDRVGWVWANQPDAVAAYTPNASFSYSSAGGAITVTPTATGAYDVAFPALADASGTPTNVTVSGYQTSGTCKVQTWNRVTAIASVLCFDAAGNAANSAFTLLYQERAAPFGSASKGMAFLWAGDPASASYTPSAFYNYNSTGGTNTMTRSGVGHYEAALPGLTTVGGHVQVTAYGAGAGRCKVAEWGQDGSGTRVSVLCFDASGAFSDQRFTLLYIRNVPAGYQTGAATTGVYGWTDRRKTKAPYKIAKTYRYNNLTHGALSADREGKGVSTVSYKGAPGFSTSNMLVTAYGGDNGYCNVQSWAPMVTQCYAQGGVAQDRRYDVAMTAKP